MRNVDGRCIDGRKIEKRVSDVSTCVGIHARGVVGRHETINHGHALESLRDPRSKPPERFEQLRRKVCLLQQGHSPVKTIAQQAHKSNSPALSHSATSSKQCELEKENANPCKSRCHEKEKSNALLRHRASNKQGPLQKAVAQSCHTAKHNGTRSTAKRNMTKP